MKSLLYHFSFLSLLFLLCDSKIDVAQTNRTIFPSVGCGSCTVVPAGTLSSQNSIIVGGHFSGNVTFGSTYISSTQGSQDFFLLSLNAATNELQWITTLGGNATDRMYGIEMDNNGEFVIVGILLGVGSSNYGGTTFTVNSTAPDIVLIKLNSTRGHKWSKIFGGEFSYDYPRSLAVDSNMNIVIGGYAGSPNTTWGGSTFTITSGTDWIVAKYDTNGDHIWSNHYGSSTGTFDTCESVAVDSNGDVFAVGWFESTFMLNATTNITTTGEEDILILKLSSVDGSLMWYKQLGSTGIDVAYDVACDSNLDFYIVGTFLSLDFGNGLTTGAYSSRDAFIVKYNSTGSFIWQQSIGGALTDAGNTVVVDPTDDSVFIGGTYRATVELNDISLPYSPAFGGFVFRFHSNGSALWGVGFPATNSTYSITAIEAAPVPNSLQNAITVTYPSAITDYNSTIVPAYGVHNALIAMITETGPLPSPSMTPSRTPSSSATPTATPSRTPTPSSTPTSSVTPTVSPSSGASSSPSVTPTRSPSLGFTPSSSPSASFLPSSSGNDSSKKSDNFPLEIVIPVIVGGVILIVAGIALAEVKLRGKKDDSNSLEVNNTL